MPTFLKAKSALSLILVLVHSFIVLGDHPDVKFKNVGIHDLLSSINVQALAMDSIGHIWIGTQNGLNKYNGYSVEQYFANDDDTTSIPDNSIEDIYLDRKGRLWVGTWNGLCQYDVASNSFIHFDLSSPYHEENSLPLIQQSRKFREDESGNLWAITHMGNLYKFNEKNQDFDFVDIPIMRDSLDVQTFEFDPENQNILWIGYENGIGRYDFVSKEFNVYYIEDRFMGQAGNNVHALIFDGPYIWVGVFRAGIYRFNKRDRTYKSYAFEGDVENYILNGIKDDKGRIWFTSGGGLFYYDKDQDSFHKYTEYINNESGTLDEGISAIFQDRNGLIWFGSTHEGLIRVIEREKFKYLGYDADNPNALQSNYVTALDIDQDQNIWIGYSAGIDIYDPDMNKMKYFAGPGSDVYDDGDIWDFQKYGDHKVWISSYSGGLEFFDQRTNEIKEAKSASNKNKLSGLDIRSISLDEEGKLWLAVHGYGVDVYDPSSNTFTNFNVENSNLPTNWSYSVFCDSHDNIWMGTMSGLFRYREKSQRGYVYQYKAGDSTSISDNVIRCMYEDSKGRMWIGTNRGLNMYVSETDQFRRVLKKHGLSDDNIAGILEDDKGKLWLSTKGGGLVTFEKESWLIDGKPITQCMKVYDASDGLQGNEFAYNAAVKGRDGFLYFGGINGLSYFHPDSIFENETPPNVIISQLKLFNKEVTPGDGNGILNKHISVTRQLDLKPHQDVITFAFTAFNYEQPEKNNYAYKLEGFDKDWYEIGTKREATYTNLPPGEYILHVRAANNDGFWNDEGQQLKIKVLPPWWKTLWFRVSLVVLIITLTYLIAFLRTRSIKQQKQLLEDLVHEKTLELEKQNIEVQEMAEKVHAADQSKIRFFMNISHEFRTPLSLILGPVNQLVNMRGLSQPVHEKHLFIQRNAHRLLRLINQLLDLRKIEVKEIQISVSHENLKSFVQSIWESFKYLAESKGVEYILEIDEYFNHSEVYFDRDIIEKSIFNLLSNAFKNVSKGDRVILQLIPLNDGKDALIKVVDTGVGIAPDKIDRIFERFYSYSANGRHKESTGIGLTLIRELIQMHKGSIDVDSKLGSGATFTIKIPITLEAYRKEELSQNQFTSEKEEFPIVPVMENLQAQETVDHYLPNILLIEDNKDLTEYIKMELSPYYNIDVAKNGKSGFDKLNKKSYQLVISDVMMPVMDGIEFTKHIRSDENWSHLPIILLTAKQGEEIRIESYEIGADAYISKPFDMQVLKARIDNLIHSRATLIEHFTHDMHLIPEISAHVNGDEAFLNKIIHIIEDHISDPQLGYKVFIDEMGMSKTKLYAKLGKLTGQSINIFIRTTRLKVAARLLKQTDLSVSEISYKVGFTDPNYFSKCFKNQFLMAPTEFKEQGADVDK